jgi:Holliday junction resolvase RusA-like endonuclease
MRQFYSIHLVIKGKPVPKTGNRKKIYENWENPREIEIKRYKRSILMQLPKNFSIIPLSIPVQVNIKYYFVPQNYEKIQNIESENIPHIKKIGDIDNLNKFLLDIGNGIIWEDDTQIYAANVMKLYSKHARTEINVLWADAIKSNETDQSETKNSIINHLIFNNHDIQISDKSIENKNNQSFNTEIITEKERQEKYKLKWKYKIYTFVKKNKEEWATLTSIVHGTRKIKSAEYRRELLRELVNDQILQAKSDMRGNKPKTSYKWTGCELITTYLPKGKYDNKNLHKFKKWEQFTVARQESEQVESNG